MAYPGKVEPEVCLYNAFKSSNMHNTEKITNKNLLEAQWHWNRGPIPLDSSDTEFICRYLLSMCMQTDLFLGHLSVQA